MKRQLSHFVFDIALSGYGRAAIVRPCYRTVRAIYARYVLGRQIKNTIRQRKPCKVILGAGKTRQHGWIPTDMHSLNVSKTSDWRRYFAPESLDALLAEHVWEHLTEDESLVAGKLCFDYLKPGGYVRVAVPDGFCTAPTYIELVKPGGEGPGAQDHKILHNYQTISSVFQLCGFKIDLLQYFDEEGGFHIRELRPDEGIIFRSVKFYNGRTLLFGYSIILDAQKPT